MYPLKKDKSEQSGNEKEKENNDPVKNRDWKPAKNNREAFKDEAKRIREDGGVKNPNNYNKINSPGEKYLNQDKNMHNNTNNTNATTNNNTNATTTNTDNNNSTPSNTN